MSVYAPALRNFPDNLTGEADRQSVICEFLIDRETNVADKRERRRERGSCARGQMSRDEETSRASRERREREMGGGERKRGRKREKEGEHEKTRQFAIEFASDFLAARRSVS